MDAFDRYIAPARAYPEIWRVIAGIVLALVVSAAWTAMTFSLLFSAQAMRDTLGPIAALPQGSSAIGILVILSTFAGLALGAILAAGLLHGRGPVTLIGPPSDTLRDFTRAVGVIAAFFAVALLLWSLVFDATPGLPLSTWLTLLPVALALILLQTGAEELFFRGYLTQQLAARFRSPYVWALLPSVAFAALHYDPSHGTVGAATVLLGVAIFGLAAVDLTQRTGNLGAAWGFHFANNTLALLLVATEGTLPGLALYRTPYTVADAGWTGLADIALTLFAWALLRRAFPRRA